MQSCVHSFFFFFARPTDPPSREGGRWETKHFMILWGWPKPIENRPFSHPAWFDWHFASCDGIQDSLGFWIPCRGFRIPATGFQPLVGFQIFFQLYSGFQSPGYRIPQQKLPGSRNTDSFTWVETLLSMQQVVLTMHWERARLGSGRTDAVVCHTSVLPFIWPRNILYF